MKNWTKYKTKQINIIKSTENLEVSQLLKQNYSELYSKLVRSKDDEGTFNDVFLKLTYKYNPNQNFVEQFIYQFKLHKGSYYRYDLSNRIREYRIDNPENTLKI